MVKTHSFKLGKYHISEGDGWVGSCDCPDNYSTLRMQVLRGKTAKALACQLHEAMHAEGCPDKFLHRDDGDPCDNIARFLVRMGWVRNCDNKAPIS